MTKHDKKDESSTLLSCFNRPKLSTWSAFFQLSLIKDRNYGIDSNLVSLKLLQYSTVNLHNNNTVIEERFIGKSASLFNWM